VPSCLRSERLNNDERILGYPLEELAQQEVDEVQQISGRFRFFKRMSIVQYTLKQTETGHLPLAI